MSRTLHHNAPKRERVAKFPDRYVGYFGEGLRTAAAIQWMKRLQHKAARRWGRLVAASNTAEALDKSPVVPLMWEVEDVFPAHCPMPPVKWRRVSHLHSSRGMNQ